MKAPRWENLEHAARDAYEGYCSAEGFTALPWEGLTLHEKQAWGASVRRTLAKAYRILAADLCAHIEADCNENVKALGVDSD